MGVNGLLSRARLVLALVAVASAVAATPGVATAATWPDGVVVVGYDAPEALAALLAEHPARIEEDLPELGSAALRPEEPPALFARAAAAHAGITFVEAAAPREASAYKPRRAPGDAPGEALQWHYAATRIADVPQAVLHAALNLTIAVIDTGADLSAPDLDAKDPAAYSLVKDGSDVADENGHGTFVAALAAGSWTNGEGVAGYGGDAGLLVLQAGRGDGAFTDVDEAKAIVYAVDHGADIINLSLGGLETSETEKRAVEYAAARGVLLVAAGGNERAEGNPVEYPAALLQPPGSDGRGGIGLVVAASTPEGRAATFSNTGSWISLAAPGTGILSAVSRLSSPALFPRVRLPGSPRGVFGFASGTSFAAPQVAGAAALVWAANPALDAAGVAEILKRTASRPDDGWSPSLGWGVIDVAAAVAAAGGRDAVGPRVSLTRSVAGGRIRLAWLGEDLVQEGVRSVGVAGYRLEVVIDGDEIHVLEPDTTRTSITYRLDPGHTYSFSLVGVDRNGNRGRPATLRVRS